MSRPGPRVRLRQALAPADSRDARLPDSKLSGTANTAGQARSGTQPGFDHSLGRHQNDSQYASSVL